MTGRPFGRLHPQTLAQPFADRPDPVPPAGWTVTLYWCKTGDGRIVEHETTSFEDHRGHVRCIEVGPP